MRILNFELLTPNQRKLKALEASNEQKVTTLKEQNATAVKELEDKLLKNQQYYEGNKSYETAGKPSGVNPFGNKPKGVIATRSSVADIPSDKREPLPNLDIIMEKRGLTIVDLNDLLGDTHTWSVVQSRKAGVLSLDWELQGDQDSPEMVFVKKRFDKLKMNSIITEMLDAPSFGYKPMEIMWIHKNEKIIPLDIVGKPPEWFYYDYNHLLRIIDKDIATGRPIPLRKFLVPRHNPSYANPYGVPLLAKCFWPVFFKTDDIRFWAVFTEVYGMPLLHGIVGGAGNVDSLLEKLEDLRQDGKIVTEENDDVTISPIGVNNIVTGSVNIYKSFASYNNAEISKTFLSETLTTEHSETGSFAMAKTHLTVKQEVVDADKKMIEEQFNLLIKWMIELNFGKGFELPKFVMFHEEDVDKPLAEVTEILSRTGIKYTKDYYIKEFGYTEDDFDVVQPSFFAEEVENIVETEVDKLSGATNSVIKQIETMINKSKSYEQAKKGLVSIQKKLDSDIQEDVIAKGIALGNAAGQLTEGIELNEGI